MICKEAVFHSEDGITAEFAAALSREAERFACAIWVSNGGRRLRMDSLISVLSIDPSAGDTLCVEAEGEDAQAAVEAIAALLCNA